MSGSYFVVNHVSDENKNDGLVESYQMVQTFNEEGIFAGMRRLNFVHWPELPVPFVHEEWSEDLEFSNIYTPELDDVEDDEEEYEEEEEEEEYEEDLNEGLAESEEQ